MKDLFVSRLSVVFAVVLFACAPLATAQKAGYDLFRTTEGTYADLTQLGLGKVDLKGVPIYKVARQFGYRHSSRLGGVG